MDGNETTERRILLVDCDAFYVQVARLEDPEGAGREPLLIVGGSSTRGVVTSASYAARAHGVHSAMPTTRARRLCPDAVVVPVPRKACVDRSRGVRGVLEDLAPVVQPASIDEFYLDVSGTERLFHGETLERTAHRIREEVLERTRISVSVGGGTRRVIAKLATRFAKPAGVHIVPAGQEEAFMRRLELKDLPGVGPALVEALARRGLVRVEDALGVQREWFQEWFGPQRGAWLHRRIRGIDSSPVDPHERRKSISSERTFFQDIDDDQELERRLLELSVSVAATIRRQEMRARTITVKLRDGDFRTRSHARTLDRPAEADATVYEVARELLAHLRRARPVPVRLLGVALSGLVDRESEQLDLFGEAFAHGDRDRDRRVSRAVDRVRGRFGYDSVVPAGVLDRKAPREGGGDPGGENHD